jgi:hypothetical protein
MVIEGFGNLGSELVHYKLVFVQKGDTTNWYQSEGFDTEPRWASGAVFEPKM